MHTAHMSLRMGLLALLDEADRDGDGLATALGTWTAGRQEPARPQVDAALDRLVQDGLAVRDDGGRCSITRVGRDLLATWFAAGAALPSTRDELVDKVLFSLPRGRHHAVAVIDHQRRALVSTLQARRRSQRTTVLVTGSGAPTPDPVTRTVGGLAGLPPVLVDDAALAQAEAELRWLDLCEARLARLTIDGETAA